MTVDFLFTESSGTTWHQLYDSPPEKIRLELGEDEIVRPGTKQAPAGSGSGGSGSGGRGGSMKRTS